MKIPYDDAYALDKRLKLEYGLLEAGIMIPNECRRSAESEYEFPKVLNCPNCGAPITGCKCEYCGTVFKQEEPAQRFYADNTEYPINAEEMKKCRLDYNIDSRSTDVYYKDQKIMKINDYEMANYTYIDFVNAVKSKIKEKIRR